MTQELIDSNPQVCPLRRGHRHQPPACHRPRTTDYQPLLRLGIDSITRFLAEDQTHKLALVAEIKKNLASIRFPQPALDPVNLTELSTTLYSLLGYLGNIRQEIPADEPALSAQIDSLRQAVIDLRKEMLRGDAAQLRGQLAQTHRLPTGLLR